MSGRVDRSSREAHERESRLEQASYGNRGPSAYGRHLPTSAEGRQKRQMALAELTDEQIEAYESVPMATPTLQKCFEALDARGTGQINVGDFCRGLQVFGAPFSIDEVEAFKKLVDRSSLEDTFRYEDVLELRASTLKDNKQEEGVPPVPPEQMESKRRLLTRKKKEQAQSNQDSAAVLAQLQSTDSAEVRGPSRQSLTKEQIAEFREAFCIFDVDGNGTVTTSELGEVMAGLGQKMSEAELQLMIDEVDADHTGTMNFEEFLDLMAIRLAGIDSEAELRDAFKTFDQDGNGFIEAEELMRVVTTMGETLQIEEAQAMLREVDVDGNGMIDYEEFTKVMLG